MGAKTYDRASAIAYAKKWALSRNPRYYNFDPVGGDCTSFISQCLYAGSKKMNYNLENGWYYNNGYIKNKSYGPRGVEVPQNKIEIGDIAQLSFSGNKFEHSLFIIDIKNINDLNKILIATHTYDALNKNIGEYRFSKIRFIHIQNVGI